MELERWAELSAAISAVAIGLQAAPQGQALYRADRAGCYLWAALFDRPSQLGLSGKELEDRPRCRRSCPTSRR